MTTLAVGSLQAAETIGVAGVASSFLHESAASAASAQMERISLLGRMSRLLPRAQRAMPENPKQAGFSRCSEQAG
jgi:hypothetical protein